MPAALSAKKLSRCRERLVFHELCNTITYSVSPGDRENSREQVEARRAGFPPA
jgi:hypothetical protein